jgi:hypothetical protein
MLAFFRCRTRQNGNLVQRMLTSTTALRYICDGWNRLVTVEHVTNRGGGETAVAPNEYQ